MSCGRAAGGGEKATQLQAVKELDGWFQGEPAVNPQPKRQKLPHHAHTEGRRGVTKAEERSLEMTRTCGRKTSLKPEVPLQNHFSTLQAGEGGLITSGVRLELSKAAPPAPCVTTSTTSKGDRGEQQGTL